MGLAAGLIGVDAARREGVDIDWRRHVRIGLPVTLGSLAVLGFWLF